MDFIDVFCSLVEILNNIDSLLCFILVQGVFFFLRIRYFLTITRMKTLYGHCCRGIVGLGS